MRGKYVFKAHGFDVIACHYCYKSTYFVEGDISTKYIIDCIPANLPEITDITVIREIHKNIMKAMNILWSSAYGVATFPEQFGRETLFSHGTQGMVFIGKGWNVTIYFNGYEAYRAANQAGADKYIEEFGAMESDDNIAEKMKNIYDDCIMSLLGRPIPIS